MPRHVTFYSFENPRQAALHARRQRAGIPVYVMARLSGMPQWNVSAIESGRKVATPEQLATLENILVAHERVQARLLREAAGARSFVSASA